MPEPSEADPRTRSLVRTIDRNVTGAQRAALLHWATRLLEIRASGAPALKKARLALDETYRAETILPVVKGLAASMKDVVWDDRSWAARLGLGAAAVTAATFGSQGAGIAALGGAIGVPLWIVLGAGGSFAGMLIDELSRPRRPGEVQSPEEKRILDAEWAFVEEGEDETAPLALEPAEPEGREPLWQVFKRTYREARARERTAAGEQLHPAADDVSEPGGSLSADERTREPGS